MKFWLIWSQKNLLLCCTVYLCSVVQFTCALLCSKLVLCCTVYLCSVVQFTFALVYSLLVFCCTVYLCSVVQFSCVLLYSLLVPCCTVCLCSAVLFICPLLAAAKRAYDKLCAGSIKETYKRSMFFLLEDRYETSSNCRCNEI